MNASVTYDSGPHDWFADQRSSFQRAFRRARRHSRVVRLLRFGIPAGVVLTVSLYGLATWVNLGTGLTVPGVGKLAISGTRITMEVPRLAGYTRDGRAYEITASSAAQDLRNPQVIELKELRAKIELENDETVNVTSDAGFYDTKSEALTLRDNVLVKTKTGTEVRLNEAMMDIRKGHVTSDKPVFVDMPTAQVRANGLEVLEGGAVVVFRGGVSTSLKGTEPAVSAANRGPAR